MSGSRLQHACVCMRLCVQGHTDVACFSARLLCTANQFKGQSLTTKVLSPYASGQRHLLDDSVLDEEPSTSSINSLQAGGRKPVYHEFKSYYYKLLEGVLDRFSWAGLPLFRYLVLYKCPENPFYDEYSCH